MRNSPLVALAALCALLLAAWLILRPRGTEGSLAAAPGVASALPGVERATRPLDGVLEPPLAHGDGDAARAEAAPASVPAADEEAAANDAPYLVSGRVVDGAGNAIGAATVYAMEADDWLGPPLDSRSYAEHWQDRIETRTDGAGRFELGGLAPGTARIAVRAAGFAPYDADRVALLPGARHELETIVLAPGVRLAGRVVDARGGVAGAELVRLDEAQDIFFGAAGNARGALLATTAADGAFLVDALAPGPWKLMVLSPEHPDQVFEGEGAEGGRDVRGLVLELQAGQAITGRVIGQGELAGLVVRATPPGDLSVRTFGGPLPWREATSDARGEFRIGGLGDHPSYTLRVRSKAARIWDTEWLSAPCEAAPGARDVTLELVPAATLVFRVVAASGELVEDWSVQLAHQDGEEHSTEDLGYDDERLTHAPDGSVVLTGLREVPPGRATSVTVSRDGYFPATSAAVRLVPGEAADAGLLELVPRPMLVVRVVDAASGRALEGVDVSLQIVDEPVAGDAADVGVRHDLANGALHTATTDAEGLARLPRIEARDCELAADGPDHAPSAPLAVRLAAGEKPGPEPAFVIALSSGAAVDVRVVDPYGAPAAATSVAVTELAEEQTEVEGTTEAEGRAAFEHLRPGRYRIEARRIGPQGFLRFVSATPEPEGASVAELELAEGARSEVQLVRPARGRLTGRIREAGAPLAGASVLLEDKSSGFGGLFGEPAARSDAEGRYAIEPLDAGSYALVISHATRAMDERIELEIEEGPNVLDCDLTVTVIEGRVFDPGGRPLSGARVEIAGAERGGGNSVVFGFSGMDGLTLEVGGSGRDPSVRSAPDGTYRLRGVRPGSELHVEASHAEHRRAREGPLRLTPDEVRVLDLRLSPAGGVEARVRATDAAAAQGVQLVATQDEAAEEKQDPVEARTDRAGLARLTGLAPGGWFVHAVGHDGTESPRQAVTITAGETTRIAVDLP